MKSSAIVLSFALFLSSHLVNAQSSRVEKEVGGVDNPAAALSTGMKVIKPDLSSWWTGDAVLTWLTGGYNAESGGIQVGVQSITPNKYRGYVVFNISSIPRNAIIDKLTLFLYTTVKSVPLLPMYEEIKIKKLSLDPLASPGSQNLYNDIGNGSQINYQGYVPWQPLEQLGWNSINLYSADLSGKILSGNVTWSIGIQDYNTSSQLTEDDNVGTFAGWNSSYPPYCEVYYHLPTPSVTSLSPSNTAVGGSAFTLTVNGSNFSSSCVVMWNGSARPTTYISNSQLSAAISASDISIARSISVTVANTSIGGSTSGPTTFVVTNPVPSISSLSPSYWTTGGPAFTLTINGLHFVANSIVNWNGASRNTVYLSSAQLKASISASDVASAETATVTVTNPSPGGGNSNALSFEVNNAPPSISSLSPVVATAGGAAFTLTVNGLNLASGATVQWNGSNRATTYISETQLHAAISTSDIGLSNAGKTVQVAVVNPSPGGGSSNSLPFTVANPLPSITSISPDSAYAAGPSFKLAVNGLNFVSGSKALWNGTERATTYVTSTQLTASIDSNDVLSPGTVSITVANPSPGGGTSEPRTLTITAPGTASPSLAYPANQAEGIPIDTIFYWSSVQGATSYHLQVSSSSSFALMVFDKSGIVDTAQRVPTLTGGMTYYWRVNSTGPGGTGSYPSASTFTTIRATSMAPTLLYPSNQTTNVPTDTTFYWDASSGATSYHVQVSSNPLFSPSTIDITGITGTSQPVSGLANGTTYYWHVNATGAGGTGAYSAPDTFTTVVASPVAPTATAATGIKDTSFSANWNVTDHATGYFLDVAINSTFTDFAPGYHDLDVGDTLSEIVTGLIPDTTYYYRVRAYNSGGTSGNSNVISLNTLMTTSVRRISPDAPTTFALQQNYPNPFNPTTMIDFSVPERTFVRLAVFDALGREVRLVVDNELSAGTYHLTFEASDLPSGIYLCRLVAGQFTDMKKMILLK